MSYRDRTRKQITLPSGATVVIRKFTPRDFLSVGSIPTVYPDPKAPKSTPNKADDERWAIGVERVIFTRCISPIQFEGETLKVVDKSFGTAGENEIEIESLDQADAEAIVSEVMTFSGLRKEAGQQAQNFPANGEGHDPIAPDGGTLRATAVNASAHVA